MQQFGTGGAERPGLGILIAGLAVMCFALGDALTKFLAERYPVPAIMAGRYCINIVLLVLFLGPRHGSRLWRTNRTGMVVARSLVVCISSMCMGYALKLIPVGEATSIVYLSPILVMVLAGRFLNERMNRVTMAGAVAGFVGVLLIVRPGSGVDPLGIAFASSALVLTTAYHLLTRALSWTETAISMQVFSAAIGAALFTLISAGDISDLRMTMPDMAVLALVGVAMTIGHYLFTLAYREGPATLIAPFTYLQLFWAAGFGWLIFDHMPDGWSLTGIAMIAVAGAAIALYTHVTLARTRASQARREPKGVTRA